MHKKLVDFSNEKHWQVRNLIGVVAHPVLSFFILDEADDFPNELVKEGLARRNVNHCKLNAAHVCAGHGDLLHGVHTTNSFNH